MGNRAGGGEWGRWWGTRQVVGNRAGGEERHMVGRALDMWFLPSGSSESSLKQNELRKEVLPWRRPERGGPGRRSGDEGGPLRMVIHGAEG